MWNFIVIRFSILIRFLKKEKVFSIPIKKSHKNYANGSHIEYAKYWEITIHYLIHSITFQHILSILNKRLVCDKMLKYLIWSYSNSKAQISWNIVLSLRNWWAAIGCRDPGPHSSNSLLVWTITSMKQRQSFFSPLAISIASISSSSQRLNIRWLPMWPFKL